MINLASFRKREMTRQALLFLGFGSITTSLNYLIFFILFKIFNVYYVYSSAIGAISGIFLGYFLNKQYTFKSKISFRVAAPLYWLINLFSVLIIIIFLPILVEMYNFNELLAYLIILIFTTLINFFGSKILAFKNREW